MKTSGTGMYDRWTTVAFILCLAGGLFFPAALGIWQTSKAVKDKEAITRERDELRTRVEELEKRLREGYSEPPVVEK